jgi:hypothetical protein
VSIDGYLGGWSQLEAMSNRSAIVYDRSFSVS